MLSHPPPNSTSIPLSSLRRGALATVVQVVDKKETLGDEAQSTLARRLQDIGFIPGERCQIINETWPSGDPMAVRIGNSTFALRRREASTILVRIEPSSPT